MQPLVFEKQVCVSGKLSPLPLFDSNGPVYFAGRRPGKLISEKCFADKNVVLIQTVVEYTEKKFISKWMESFNRNGSYIYQTVDNFRVPRFKSEEPETKLDSRLALYKFKNVDWDSDSGNVASSSGEVYAWFSRNVFQCTFLLNQSINFPWKKRHRKLRCWKTF